MHTHRKLIVAAATALTMTSTAYAADQAHLAGGVIGSGPTAVNAATCKLVHAEVDLSTGTFQHLRAYTLREDGIHDNVMSCLRRRVFSLKTGAPGPQGPAGPAGKNGVSGYVRVSSAINFHQASASATCPAGDVVISGGADVEVSGSYPSTDTTWTVGRDSVWGRQKSGSVYAVCAAKAS